MPSTTRDVLLVSGQGSNNHLANPQTASKLLDLLKQEERETFGRLLKLCRDAFRLEIASATPDEQRLLGDDVFQVFDEPDSLLLPPRKFQSHPIFETASLYLHQILELILFQSHENSHHVVEVAGICTGVLPAALAGCYTSFFSDDFIAAALQGFRLAFWIGLRAEEKNRSTEQMPDESEASCLLSVFGSGLDAVSQLIQLHPYGNNVRNLVIQCIKDCQLIDVRYKFPPSSAITTSRSAGLTNPCIISKLPWLTRLFSVAGHTYMLFIMGVKGCAQLWKPH